jgi:signal transduction histidine kinase/ActR/RegA family two-component response regulator
MLTNSKKDGRGEAKVDRKSRASPVIERAPLPMVEVEGPEHTVCFVNPAFCRLLDLTSEQLVGKHFTDIVQNGHSCVPLLDRVYQTGQSETHVESDNSQSDPAHWLFAMWPSLGVNREPERVVIQLTRSVHFHQNVAAMNEALILGALRQHELREIAETSNSQLQTEIAERKVAGIALHDAIDHLREAKSAAERGSRTKDDFLAALSHELRTPLTPVLLTAATLREDPRLPTDVRDQMDVIERSIALEARLIDDLLDLTKISRGKLEFRPEPCDAHQLIAYAVDIVRADANAKEIVINCSLSAKSAWLVADSTRFQQVIWNLLRNAVKFTPPHGRVSVRTRNETNESGASWLRIEVSDTGIGIQPERLEEIFLPFDQGGLTGDHRFGGVGLGLAIARAVVQLHSGRITAQSGGRNHGSTIIVELPGAMTTQAEAFPPASTRPSPSLHRSPSASPSLASGTLRLLIVEDHINTLEALRSLLQKDGHRVTIATSISKALAAAAANTFDLVISDLGLPDGTGVELMRELRNRYGLQGIALSGYGMDDDIASAHRAGFATHLTKPVAIAELRRVIAGLQNVAKPVKGDSTAKME